MEHTPFGYWIGEAGPPVATAPLEGTVEADVAVVGGGYLGLWTAWHVLERAPGARVAIVESGVGGTGPSGRNGGFVNGYWDKAPAALTRYGPQATRELLLAAQASVDAIGAWCAEQEVDAWFRPAAHLEIATSPLQDGAWEEAVAACAAIGEPAHLRAIGPGAVASFCRSPVFRGGALIPAAATVQPARLAFGLRTRLLERGALLFERTPARRVEDGPSPRVVTPGGEVRAGAVVLAVNHAAAGVR
ncbi:MAG TPA: FAD-dependent oxidoreductase, partial [Solirubrobacteraceae bacterium]|nr:FAD-dependent oxidoreductase [Solirubrobacteraceae bacterium]